MKTPRDTSTMKPGNPIHPPSSEVYDFLDVVRINPAQDVALEEALTTYARRRGYTGDPLLQPVYVLLGRMVEVGISVPSCVEQYLKEVEDISSEGNLNKREPNPPRFI